MRRWCRHRRVPGSLNRVALLSTPRPRLRFAPAGARPKWYLLFWYRYKKEEVVGTTSSGLMVTCEPISATQAVLRQRTAKRVRRRGGLLAGAVQPLREVLL